MYESTNYEAITMRNYRRNKKEEFSEILKLIYHENTKKQTTVWKKFYYRTTN